MAPWIPPIIDTDAILLSIFIVAILIGMAVIGIWQLGSHPFLGLMLIFIAFIGAVIYFQLVDFSEFNPSFMAVISR